jgi:osmotically-inducible protein OsmY
MAHTLLSDVASQAKAILERSRIFDLRALEVEQEADCVVLRGSVDSFYHKQLAQELLKTAIDGVEVINEIHVDYSRERADDDCDWQW